MSEYAWAVYRKDIDWIPLSSISCDPESARRWILKTYIGGTARAQCAVIRIKITRIAALEGKEK